MSILYKLLLLTTFLLLTLSQPTNCNNGSSGNSILSLEDIEDLEIDETSTLEVPCVNQRVCTVECNSAFPGNRFRSGCVAALQIPNPAQSGLEYAWYNSCGPNAGLWYPTTDPLTNLQSRALTSSSLNVGFRFRNSLMLISETFANFKKSCAKSVPASALSSRTLLRAHISSELSRIPLVSSSSRQFYPFAPRQDWFGEWTSVSQRDLFYRYKTGDYQVYYNLYMDYLARNTAERVQWERVRDSFRNLFIDYLTNFFIDPINGIVCDCRRIFDKFEDMTKRFMNSNYVAELPMVNTARTLLLSSCRTKCQ